LLEHLLFLADGALKAGDCCTQLPVVADAAQAVAFATAGIKLEPRRRSGSAIDSEMGRIYVY